jgi:hypothetical protein
MARRVLADAVAPAARPTRGWPRSAAHSHGGRRRCSFDLPGFFRFLIRYKEDLASSTAGAAILRGVQDWSPVFAA